MHLPFSDTHFTVFGEEEEANEGGTPKALSKEQRERLVPTTKMLWSRWQRERERGHNRVKAHYGYDGEEHSHLGTI